MINKFESGDFYGGSQAPGNNGGGYYSPFPSWDEFTLLDESKAKKRFSRVFLALFLYQIIAYAIIFAAQLAVMAIFGAEKAESILGNYTFVMLSNFVAMYLIAFPILYLILRGMRSVERPKRDMSIKELFSLFLVAEAFMYFGNLVGSYLNAFISALTGAEIENGIANIIENAPMWLIIFMVVLVGPVVEELIFRKLLFDKLGHYGDRLVIIVSAIAFGLFHGNLYQFFYAVLVGLVLGYVYSRTANIVYPIIIHVLLNFMGSVIPMLIYDEINAFTELSELMMSGAEYDIAEYGRLSLIVGTYSMIELALVIAGVVIFFKKRRSIFISDRCEVLIPKARRVAVTLLNVGAMLFLIFAIILMATEIIMPIIDNLNNPTPPVTDTPGDPNNPELPETPGSTDQNQQIPGDSLLWLIEYSRH